MIQFVCKIASRLEGGEGAEYLLRAFSGERGGMGKVKEY
jgi:hypothetical protein